MKKVLLLFVLFIILVVALAPAKIILWFMPQHSPIVLQGMNGSLWSPEINRLSYKQMNFEDVKLSPNLLSLIMAELNINFDIVKGDIAGSGDLILSQNLDEKLLLENANLKTTANRLEAFIKMKGLKIDGNIETSDLTLKLENKKLTQALGKVSLFSSKVDLFGGSWSLGDFIVRLSTDKETQMISGELQKSKNQLGLQGKFNLDSKGLFEFVGSISTDTDKQIYSAISLFADGPVNNNRLPIKYKQKIF